jgi:hypothetical protein
MSLGYTELFAERHVAVLPKTTSSISDNIHALTNKGSQHCVVDFYAALNSQSVGTKQSMADCIQR